MKKLINFCFLACFMLAQCIPTYASEASTLPIYPELPYQVNKVYLPLILRGIRYIKGAVISCVPNAGVTYVNGMIYKGTQPVNGATIVFGVNQGEPHIAEIISGPHRGYPDWRDGFFSIILGAHGPRKADWYFWVLSDKRAVDSVYIHLHTDGIIGADSCQQGQIEFNTQ